MSKTKTAKSGAGTQPLKVLKISDLPTNLGLDQKSEMLQENRRAVFMHNLSVLQEKMGKNQAQFCRETLQGLISEPRLTGFKKPGNYVSPHVMGVVAAATGISVETLCGTLLDGNHIPPPPEEGGAFEKFLGTHSLAYFRTGDPAGDNRRPTAQSVMYGVLTIYARIHENQAITYHVIAFLDCGEKDRATIDAELNGIDLTHGDSRIRQRYEALATSPVEHAETTDRRSCLYEGEIRLAKMAEMELDQVYGSDHVHILMHNMASESDVSKPWRGGLATMMSVSRGREHCPCVQGLLLSRKGLEQYSKEFLAGLLYMDPPKVNIDTEVRDVIAYMRLLYQEEDDTVPPDLAEEDKQYCLETYVDMKLRSVLKRNHLSAFKITRERDWDVYQKLVHENH